jgi:hypothetical protein
MFVSARCKQHANIWKVEKMGTIRLAGSRALTKVSVFLADAGQASAC